MLMYFIWLADFDAKFVEKLSLRNLFVAVDFLTVKNKKKQQIFL